MDFLKSAVYEFLIAHGYDGLGNDDGTCGCGVEDLMPCCCDESLLCCLPADKVGDGWLVNSLYL